MGAALDSGWGKFEKEHMLLLLRVEASDSASLCDL